MSQMSVENVQEFLDGVEIAEFVETEFEGLELDTQLPQPDFDTNKDQSVVVGSQIAGFSEDVPGELRPILTNVFLLAQLVADKKSETVLGPDWYTHYLDTLSKVGWLKTAQAETTQVISGTSVEVHQEILPIITSAFGPAVSATSSVLAILKGLDAMDKNLPWITLFNQRSRRATSNPFQISQTRMEGGVPAITLVAFDLDASKSVTQVLFFKFSSDKATLKHFNQSLSAAVSMLEATELKVKSIVSEHIASNLAAIEDLVL